MGDLKISIQVLDHHWFQSDSLVVASKWYTSLNLWGPKILNWETIRALKYSEPAIGL